MTKEALIGMLKQHDWYYDMSDDHKVWTSGGISIQNLRKVFDNTFRTAPDLVKEACKEFLSEVHTSRKREHSFATAYILEIENDQLSLGR